MISLPNNCSRSEFSVFPKNWNTQKASLKKKWYINYRFHDPGYPKAKQVLIKGMNIFRELKERQDATRIVLEDEWRRLHEEGYNPFTGASYIEAVESSQVSEYTILSDALQYAFTNLQCREKTKTEVRKALVHINAAIRILRYTSMPISAVKRKHVRFVLDRIGVAKGGWTASTFNHYRSYLMMLFDVLQEIEVADIDLRKIKKKKELAEKRMVLTAQQRKDVHENLNQPRQKNFLRFIQIFFHSGSRIAELLTIKKEDVDLASQIYDVVIYKGSRPRRIPKPIKTIALPYWKELVDLAGPGEYLFSKFLKPGPVQINPHQVTKRWRIHVKQKLEIEADIYSLKHLHTTEVSELLNSRMAAKLNGHTSEAMVIKIYDVNREARENELIRTVDNPFVPEAIGNS